MPNVDDYADPTPGQSKNANPKETDLVARLRRPFQEFELADLSEDAPVGAAAWVTDGDTPGPYLKREEGWGPFLRAGELFLLNTVAFSDSGGLHEETPAGEIVGFMNSQGSFYLGRRQFLNLLAGDLDPGSFKGSLPMFAVSQRAERIFFQSARVVELGDPADIMKSRAGPEGRRSTVGLTFADLTGGHASGALGQDRLTPFRAPYKGYITFSIAAATDICTATSPANHGLVEGEKMWLRRGCTAAPFRNTDTPIKNGAFVWVRDVTPTTFKVAETQGGAAVDFTTDGVGEFDKPGAKDNNVSIIESQRAAEMARDVTGDNDPVIGAAKRWTLARKRYGEVRDLAQFNGDGQVELGFAAVGQPEGLVTIKGFKGQNAKFRVTMLPTITGGTFTLYNFGTPPASPGFFEPKDSDAARKTANIAWNCTAGDMQTALEALASIGAGNVTCTGGPFPSAFIDVEFTGTLARTNIMRLGSTDSLTPSSALAFTAEADTDTFTAVAHGLSTGTPIRFTGASLPAPIQAGVDYFAIKLTNDTFQVSETFGELDDLGQPADDPVDLTTDGSGSTAVARVSVAWRQRGYPADTSLPLLVIKDEAGSPARTGPLITVAGQPVPASAPAVSPPPDSATTAQVEDSLQQLLYNLRSSGVLQTNVLSNGLTGYIETPDHADFDITGDIDLRGAGMLTDWSSGTARALIGKWTESGNQRSYRLFKATGSVLRLTWSTNGASGTVVTADSTVALTTVVSDNQWILLRATLDVDDGAGNHVVNFYYKAWNPLTYHADLISDSGWTQLGATVTVAGTTSIFSGTAPVRAGATFTSVAATIWVNGKIAAACIKNGIAGTAVASPDFNRTTGEASFTDSFGRVWTPQSTATYAAV